MQRAARQDKESVPNVRDLQLSANPSNARWITRNEQESGSIPLLGSPEIGLDELITLKAKERRHYVGALIHY